MGHLTWAALVRRESLSIFTSIYAFIRRCYFASHALWPSLQRELRQFSALLPLLTADLSLRWSGVATVSDASEIGFAVLERAVGETNAGSWGRQAETWRYRCEAAVQARAHALGDPLNIDVQSLEIDPRAYSLCSSR